MRRFAVQILGIMFIVALAIMVPIGLGWLLELVLPFSWFESSVLAGIGLATLLIMMMLDAVRDDARDAFMALFPVIRGEDDEENDADDDDDDDDVFAEFVRRARFGPQVPRKRREQRKKQRLARKQQRR